MKALGENGWFLKDKKKSTRLVHESRGVNGWF
jgi:hypothetical protein